MSADTQKILNKVFWKEYDFDPNGTDPVDVAWVDARPFRNFAFKFFRTVGTGDVDTYRIIGNTQVNGGGDDVVIKTKTLTGAQPNALADQTHLEVSDEELNAAGVAAGKTLIGISAQVEFQTGTDEATVSYLFTNPRHAYKDLTADIIA